MAAKLRRLMVVTFAAVLYYLGIWKLVYYFRRWTSGDGRVCVLCLHRVLPDAEHAQTDSMPSMVLKESTFDAMVQHLKSAYRVISLREFFEKSAGGGEDSRPACLVTFDDGWRDNYTTALPGLKKHGVPAIIFLTTGALETSGGFWVERLARAWRGADERLRILARFRQEFPPSSVAPELEELIETCKRMPSEKRQLLLNDILLPEAGHESGYDSDKMLTWGQAAEMKKSGMEFGSHTVTHPLLTFEDDATVEQELTRSKRDIESKLATRVNAFAYPNGDWNDRIRKMVQEAGYEFAFTIQRGWYQVGEDQHSIPRFVLHEGSVTGLHGRFSPAILALRLSGWN